MRLKKSLGQHFLRDKGVVKRIVDAGEITPQDRVVEIGPGGGALTEEILKRNPKETFLVEIDSYWADYLKERFKDKVKVFNQDATKFDFSSLGKGLKFFGNLPYNASTRIIRNLLNYRSSLKKGVFMVQKEVADRLTSTKGKEYGYLPALLQNFFTLKKLFTVPPGAFTPPPKVMSTVFLMEPKEFEMEEGELLRFESFLKRAFSQRRKKLKRNLGLKEPPKELSDYLERRAEELSPSRLLELFRKLEEGRAINPKP
ncbi:16S rRNA (adenine(1518)-N(6)/adenine(1519)-N(6))-dimethyltransferase RsmA [Thermovibrio sp.]